MSIKTRVIRKVLSEAQKLINKKRKNLKQYESYKKKGPRITAKSELRYKSKQKPKTGGGQEPVTTTGTRYGAGSIEHKVHRPGIALASKRWGKHWPHEREGWRSQMDRMYGGIHMSQDPKKIKKSIKILTKKLKKKKVKKLLAGGLLYPGIRVAVKYARPLWKAASKKVYDRAGKTSMSKLQIKLNKASDLQKNFSKMQLKDLSSTQIKEMSKFLPKLKAYKSKIKDTAKAWLEKEYRFGKKKKILHSEGGEVVVGKNVDRSLL